MKRYCNSRALVKIILTLVLWVVFSFPAHNLYAQNWTDLGSGGMSDWVYATTIYNGDLIVGGKFTSAGGISASHIARWDGSNWYSLGTGVNSKVNALIVHDGLLYVGGEFTEAGGIPMNFIAIWDGAQWLDDMGDMGSIVTSFAIFNNNLIIGGYFTDADGFPANYIVEYNTNGWAALGTGMGGAQGQVMALEVYNNELIAAGFFTSAGGVSANHIAKWNGATWSPLAAGISGIVYSLATYNGNLVAGGLFLNAGGISANHIALWDNTTWSALGGGMSGTFYQYVFALEVYNGNLIAGGYFTHSDGVLTNGIARWNGSAWSDLNGGLFYPGNVFGAHTLCVYGTQLIAGGLFNYAGGVNVSHIAAWYETPAGTNQQEVDQQSQFTVYPNPFQTSATLFVDLPETENLKWVVNDFSGKEILRNYMNVQHSGEGAFPIHGVVSWSPGVYFLEIFTGKTVKVIKLIRY